MTLEEKRAIFEAAGDEIRRQMAELGITEEEIQEDFEAWRRERRRPCSAS